MDYSPRSIRKLYFFIVACFFTFSSFSQEYYIDNTTLSAATGNEGKTYNYTGTVTLTDGFVANSANGSFTITPIPINPPPSTDQNFVRVEVPKIPVNDEETLTLMGPDDKSVSYTYSDGVGRTLMASAASAGPNYEDLIQPNYYDQTTGRSDNSYLPFTQSSTNGAYLANAHATSQSYYSNPPSSIVQDSKSNSYVEYDDRGRVVAAVASGEAWHTSSPLTAKKTEYKYFGHDPTETNASVDFPVIKWQIINNEPETSENYAANELSVTMVTDPQGRKTRSVTDMRGLTITAQSYDTTTQKWYGSYNVYDEYGRVRFVIPPLLTAGLTFGNVLTNPSTTQIEELMFEYKYDDRGRVTQQKSPGSGWTYFVYDDWDRLVMARHQSQKSDGTNDSWTFYKYDALNRQVMSGEITTNDSRSTVVGKLGSYGRFETGNSTSIGYTLNNSFPRLGTGYDYTSYQVQTVNYYDDYSFISNTNWDTDLPSNSFSLTMPSGFSGTQLSNRLNKSTGSKVLVLGSSPEKWLNTVVYYDDDHRMLQTISENHLGGLDRITNQLDWEGEMEKMLLEHSSATDNVDVLTEYEYAHNGLLEKTFQTIDGGTRVTVGDYHYNALGELIEKNLHSENGTSYLQSIDYQYNIQSALKAINDPDLSSGGDSDLFGMKYHYETNLGLAGTESRYDGLVNTMEYNATNVTPSVSPSSGPDGQTKTALGFDYDERNRLKGTKFAQGTGSSYNLNVGDMDMSSDYDANGNITSLTRKNDGSTIDNLTYTYEDSNNSNKLTKVEDAATEEGFSNSNRASTQIDYNGEYDYDVMGNMTSDAHKELYLTYNHLQLVEKIEFENGANNVETTISYTYDAVGNLLSKSIIDEDNNTIAKVDYVGIVEYLDDEINQIFTNEGRVYQQNDIYHYEYFITDHQGNNRVSFGNLPERNVYAATMESSRSSYENSHFSFPSNIRSTAENHTPLGKESVALNGAIGREVGPAKVLTITGGDEVDLEVWAKYTDTGWDNSTVANIISTIVSTYGGASAGTGGEGASTSLNSALSSGAPGVFSGNTSNQPEAYLQYIFFDNSYNYVSSKSGFVAVGNASNGEFAKLAAPTIKFNSNESGYLFVYVVNESNQDKNVFFDDFKITHSSSNSAFRVTQVNDYYPYGLPTSKSWRPSGYVDPGLMYQSSYASYDSLTGYYDFLSRSYDPVLGRFFAVDPAGQFSSPYAGMGNMPHMGIDPNGEVFWLAIGAAALIGGTAKGIQSYNAGQGFFNGFWQGALIGAGAAAGGIGVSAWASGSTFAAVGAGTANVGFGGVVAGGAASGFVSGSANAWMNGASFSDGLGAGFQSALVGGVTAGVLKGIGDGMGELANRAMDKEATNLKNATASVKHEWAYDEVTGTWKLVSLKGGQKDHYFHIGEWVDNGTGFKGKLYYSSGSKAINAFRIWQSAQSTVSAFIVPTTGLSGYFLEPAGPSTTVRNQDQRIPAGQYNLDWYNRPNGTIMPRLSNVNVPKDRLILSHPGNYPGDTAGCQLPGCSWGGGNYVGPSGPMMARINGYFNRVGIESAKWNIFDAF